MNMHNVSDILNPMFFFLTLSADSRNFDLIEVIPIHSHGIHKSFWPHHTLTYPRILLPLNRWSFSRLWVTNGDVLWINLARLSLRGSFGQFLESVPQGSVLAPVLDLMNWDCYGLFVSERKNLQLKIWLDFRYFLWLSIYIFFVLVLYSYNCRRFFFIEMHYNENYITSNSN